METARNNQDLAIIMIVNIQSKKKKDYFSYNIAPLILVYE